MGGKEKPDSEIISQLLDGNNIHFIVKPELLIKELVQLRDDVARQIYSIGQTKQLLLDQLSACNFCNFEVAPCNLTICYGICQNLHIVKRFLKENFTNQISEVKRLLKIKYSEEINKPRDPKINELEAEIKRYNNLIQQVVLKCIQ